MATLFIVLILMVILIIIVYRAERSRNDLIYLILNLTSTAQAIGVAAGSVYSCFWFGFSSVVVVFLSVCVAQKEILCEGRFRF